MNQKPFSDVCLIRINNYKLIRVTMVCPFCKKETLISEWRGKDKFRGSPRFEPGWCFTCQKRVNVFPPRLKIQIWESIVNQNISKIFHEEQKKGEIKKRSEAVGKAKPKRGTPKQAFYALILSG